MVGVDQSVDAALAESVDELLHLVKVGIIVGLWGAFDGFPHDPQSHEVEPPIHEVVKLLVCQRELRVPGLALGNVGMHLVHNVDSVEDD